MPVGPKRDRAHVVGHQPNVLSGCEPRLAVDRHSDDLAVATCRHVQIAIALASGRVNDAAALLTKAGVGLRPEREWVSDRLWLWIQAYLASGDVGRACDAAHELDSALASPADPHRHATRAGRLGPPDARRTRNRPSLIPPILSWHREVPRIQRPHGPVASGAGRRPSPTLGGLTADGVLRGFIVSHAVGAGSATPSASAAAPPARLRIVDRSKAGKTRTPHPRSTGGVSLQALLLIYPRRPTREGRRCRPTALASSKRAQRRRAYALASTDE
jgi:hypothetical protein